MVFIMFLQHATRLLSPTAFLCSLQNKAHIIFKFYSLQLTY